MGAPFNPDVSILRNYQDYAVEAGFNALAKKDCASIIAAPTGTGKSLIIAGLLKKIYSTYPDYPHRTMVLTHVKELIEQNHAKLMGHWPQAVAGIYSSGLGKKEMYCPITFAGIASIYRQAAALGKIDIVIIDECHLIGGKGDGMYLSFLRALKVLNPNLRILGLTATPYRVGLGILTDGELFNDVCCDMTGLEAFNWFVEEGYLCPLIPRKTDIEFEEGEIRTTAGDYNLLDMDRVVNTKDKNAQAVDEIIRKGQDRKSWLVFGVSIDHVEKLSQLFNDRGINSTYIHSKMKDEERDGRIAAFKSGEYRCLINNGILTTGFDMPSLDLIAILRLTKSPGLWVQILGRGTRPDYEEGYDLAVKEGRLEAIANSDKQNCLILDFGKNTPRLGPINDVVMPNKKGKGKSKAPVRLCHGCEITYFHISLTNCPDCGHYHPRALQEEKFNSSSGEEELIRKVKVPKVEEPDQVVEFKVNTVEYSLHQPKDSSKPNSLLVTYQCGIRSFSEYMCFDHRNYPKAKARALWRERVSYTTNAENPVPESVLEALDRTDELRIPTSIRVTVNKKFNPIVSYGFGQPIANNS